MTDKTLIPPSPSEDDYVRQVASAEALPQLSEADPFALFNAWLAEALAKEPNDANAMSLATVDAQGMPDVRMVLLKDADARGFVFYSNVGSAKGRELAANPKAALLFHWKSLRRQVRVRGNVSPVTDAEADAYFATRPKQAQIGAWASKQSQPLESRFAFEQAIAKVAARYLVGEAPRPPGWSGWLVTPARFEFWHDRPFRLHDRIEFRRDAPDQPWSKTRLYP